MHSLPCRTKEVLNVSHVSVLERAQLRAGSLWILQHCSCGCKQLVLVPLGFSFQDIMQGRGLSHEQSFAISL